MKYLVLIRFTQDNKPHEIIKCFEDYDTAFTYAQNEHEHKAEEVTCSLYKLKDFWK